ncbi:hypothetical protein [Streptomyces sp. NPDC002611]
MVLGSLIFGVGWFLIEHALDERKFLKYCERTRSQPPTPEDICIGMRERKHDTMRRMRQVAKEHRRT